MAKMMIQDALDYCLENPEGLSVEELLGRFPEYREELAPMLGLAARVVGMDVPPVPLDRRAAMKARLMERMKDEGRRTKDGQRSPVVGRPPSTVRLWYLRPAWVVAAAAAVLLAFIWWSAAGALPDSPFYGIKLASDSVRANLQGSDADKTRTHIGLAYSRLYDLRAMQERGRLAEARPAFDNYAANLYSSVSLWEALPTQAHSDLAGLLYTASEAGRVTFEGFGVAAANLPATMQENLKQTQSALLNLRDEATQELVATNVDLASLLSSADANIAPLLTPVAPGVVAVPTTTADNPPVIAGVSPTSVVAASTATIGVSTSVAVAPSVVGGAMSTVGLANPDASPTANVLPFVTRTGTPTPMPLLTTATLVAGQASATATRHATIVATAVATIKGATATSTSIMSKHTATATPTRPGIENTPSVTATSTTTSTATSITSPTALPTSPLPSIQDKTPTPTEVVVKPVPTNKPSGVNPTPTSAPPVPPPITSNTPPPTAIRSTDTPKPEPGAAYTAVPPKT